MQTYLVGGAVRDKLLGLSPGDRDFVVVGETQEAMIARGFRPVGRDFPVFLHPRSNEEYALARTERKSGRGYRGFVVDADPTVTLEQDLARRDFTINAIAQAGDGRLIDPFGGARDIEARILRHVGPAFAEDPLRVLRAARFMARFASLGFQVAPETRQLMRALVASGELSAPQAFVTRLLDGRDIRDQVVDQNAERGESDRRSQVEEHDQQDHCDADGQLGTVRRGKPRVDGGQEMREVMLPGHGHGRSSDAGDQRKQRPKGRQGRGDLYQRQGP